jgi:low density lipoprotein receptor-related protein 5/6
VSRPGRSHGCAAAARPDLADAKLDGSGEEIVFQPGVTVCGIDLDLSNSKIYWATGYGGKVYRANLDGTDTELLVSSNRDIPRLQLDVAGGKMYWAGDDVVQRANLDGTVVETLVTGLENAIGIELDLTANKLYWPDNFANTIGRANLDGSESEIIVTIPEPPYNPNPLDLTVIPVPEPSMLSFLALGSLLVTRRRR